MRLRRLEVENFRGVRSATIDFGPGVNVLHGPNELGKSTLVEAVRAALLTKPSSTQADTYLLETARDLSARLVAQLARTRLQR